MSHSRSLVSSVLLAIFVSTLPVAAADPAPERNWGQWRGPLGTGEAPQADPPVEWSESKNLKWKVKVPGRGTSTPIVWEDRIFLLTAIPAAAPAEGAKSEEPAAEKSEKKDPPAEGSRERGRGRRGGGGRGAQALAPQQFAVLCLDRATGKTLWQKVAKEEKPHEGHHQDHGFASFSPVTDGERVYAFFGSRGLHCYDLQGNLKWQKDLGRMRTKNSFGEGTSPGLHGDTLVINWDHEGDDFIVAFDKRTGDERWRQPRDEDTTWSTPIFVRHGEGTQVITTATTAIRSYDLASGKQVWECSGLTQNVIPTPVARDGMVYATSGFRGNAFLAIRLGKTGDLDGTDAIVWKHGKATPYVPSPLLLGDRLWFCSGNNALISSLEATTGKVVLEPQRIEGLQGVYASPVAAKDRIYLVGRNGATAVLKGADKLEVLATNRLDERIDASPAIAGNELFLRGHEHLYCIAASK